MRLRFLLVFCLVLCALGVITSQHRARGLFIDLERAQEHAKRLDVEWNQLQLDQTAASKHGLIDPVARRDLQMVAITPARTVYLDVSQPLPPAAAPVPHPSASRPGASASYSANSRSLVSQPRQGGQP